MVANTTGNAIFDNRVDTNVSLRYIYADDTSTKSARGFSTKFRAESKASEVLSEDIYADATRKFFSDVLYAKRLLSNDGNLTLLMQALSVRHDYFAAFFGYSLRNRRFLRWLRLIYSLFLVLFLDTIFYQVFYPENGFCENLTSEVDCLSHTNKALNANTCNWQVNLSFENGGVCSLNPPPKSFIFNVIIAFLIVISSLPPIVIFDFVVDQYAMKRPKLYEIGIPTEIWFGTATWSLGKNTI